MDGVGRRKTGTGIYKPDWPLRQKVLTAKQRCLRLRSPSQQALTVRQQVHFFAQGSRTKGPTVKSCERQCCANGVGPRLSHPGVFMLHGVATRQEHRGLLDCLPARYTFCFGIVFTSCRTICNVRNTWTFKCLSGEAIFDTWVNRSIKVF